MKQVDGAVGVGNRCLFDDLEVGLKRFEEATLFPALGSASSGSPLKGRILWSDKFDYKMFSSEACDEIEKTVVGNPLAQTDMVDKR